MAPVFDQYETDELRKLHLLIEAAQLNSAVSGGGRIMMSISGNNPSMSITVEAYVLAKFIKENYRPS